MINATKLLFDDEFMLDEVPGKATREMVRKVVEIERSLRPTLNQDQQRLFLTLTDLMTEQSWLAQDAILQYCRQTIEPLVKSEEHGTRSDLCFVVDLRREAIG